MNKYLSLVVFVGGSVAFSRLARCWIYRIVPDAVVPLTATAYKLQGLKLVQLCLIRAFFYLPGFFCNFPTANLFLLLNI